MVGVGGGGIISKGSEIPFDYNNEITDERRSIAMLHVILAPRGLVLINNICGLIITARRYQLLVIQAT